MMGNATTTQDGSTTTAMYDEMVRFMKNPLGMKRLRLNYGFLEYRPIILACNRLVALDVSWWIEDNKSPVNRARIADLFRDGIAELKGLRELRLRQRTYSHGYTPTEDAFTDQTIAPLVASSSSKLRHLHLQNFYRLTDKTWKAVASNCSELRSIYMELYPGDFFRNRDNPLTGEDLTCHVDSLVADICSSPSLDDLTLSVFAGARYTPHREDGLRCIGDGPTDPMISRAAFEAFLRWALPNPVTSGNSSSSSSSSSSSIFSSARSSNGTPRRLCLSGALFDDLIAIDSQNGKALLGDDYLKLPIDSRPIVSLNDFHKSKERPEDPISTKRPQFKPDWRVRYDDEPSWH